MEQLKENIGIFSKFDPTMEDESKLIQQVLPTMVNLVPCTACRYCCDGCPQGLDIPKLISMYNESAFDNPWILRFTLDAMKESELPAACLSCGACKQLCPQGIDIPDIMEKFNVAIKKMYKH
jgi:uncharacterized protein